MAHFKRGNLQLKTNQEIQLGDSQEALLTYDGAELTLNTDENVAFNVVGDIFMGVASGGKGGGVDLQIKQSTEEFNVGVDDVASMLNLQRRNWQIGSGSININYTDGVGTWEVASGNNIVIDGSGAIADSSITFTLSSRTAMKMNSENAGDAVELYHDGVKAFETQTDGVNIFNSSGQEAEITFQPGHLEIINKVHGSGVILKAENISGVEKTLFFGDPDNASNLYYAGSQIFSTTSIGFRFGSLTEAYLEHNGVDTILTNTQDTGHIILKADNTSSVLNTLADFDPDGAADLYYSGNKVLSTFSNGSLLYNPSDNANYLHTVVSTGVQMIMNTQGSNWLLKGEKSGGGGVNLIDAQPDGSVNLYYNGTLTSRTFGAGADIGNGIVGGNLGSFVGTQYGNDAGNGIIYNWDHGGVIKVRGENAGGSAKDMAIFDPGGSSELYHAGDLKLSTDETGVTVIGTITANDLVVDGNSIILGGTSLTEVAGGGLKVDGDLEVTGSLNLPEGSVEASDVNYNEVAGATYSTLQEGLDQLQSAGVISGGVISEDSTANISVTAGTGLIRTSDSDTAPIVFIDWSGTSIYLAEDLDKAIVVKYNAGSPAVFAEDPANVNTNNMIVLGEVETLDGALFFSNTRQRAGNFNAKLLGRLYDTTPVVRANHAGLILGESADNNRYITMTAGDVWNLLELDSIAAIDTGVADEYTRYWSDGGVGWNTLSGQTIWPNTEYDNGSGTLGILNSDRYTSLWFYLIPSDNTLHMVYGVTNDKNLAVAEAEAAPSDLPVILRDFSVLIGRFIIKGELTLATEVQSAFGDTLNLTASTNHSNLSNLDVDDHTQYSLVSGARDFTGTVGGIDPVSATDFVTLQYMATLGTDRTRLTYDGTTDLDISIEHIVDIKYAEFDLNSGAPPWKEGRVFWDNENNTFGVYNDVAEVTLQVGQETHVKIRNESGSLIPNGTVCYVSGASQGRALVLPAIATSEVTSEGILVATHDLDNNENGYGTIIGMVRGIDLCPSCSEGIEIYLSPFEVGRFTTIRPTAPNYVVDIGNVVSIDGTTGDILVQILNHGSFESLADVSIPTTPINGETLVYDSSTQAWTPESQPKVVSYTLPLTGVTDVQVPLAGSFVTKGTGETGDVAVDFPISNQHVWILINSITGADSTGAITLTGTSLSESTAVPVSSDTEVIQVDSTGGVYYQSDKKWWEITNIAISGDIAAIDYDYGSLGYPDFGNTSFKVLGYRMDAFSAGNSPDLRLIISKVHDLGDKKVEFIDLEDIGVDSGAVGDQIIDHIRTGGDDRSYDPAVTDIWLNNETLTFKQLDFDDYWTNNENEVYAATAHEGIFIRIEGEPDGGGITNVDFVDLLVYFSII